MKGTGRDGRVLKEDVQRYLDALKDVKDKISTGILFGPALALVLKHQLIFVIGKCFP